MGLRFSDFASPETKLRRFGHLQRNAELSGFFLKQANLLFAVTILVIGCASVDIFMTMLEQAVDQPCEAWPWSSARELLGEASRGLVDLVGWRARHTPESWKLRLELGLRNAALLERIREGTRLGRPLGSAEFLERIEAEFRVATRGGGERHQDE